jgi:hypothetical protein
MPTHFPIVWSAGLMTLNFEYTIDACAVTDTYLNERCSLPPFSMFVEKYLSLGSPSQQFLVVYHILCSVTTPFEDRSLERSTCTFALTNSLHNHASR